MAVRGSKTESIQQNVKALQKGIRKAYIYWALGIMIAALGLKPASINAAGFSLVIEHPEIIQGVLYLGGLYEALTALLFFQPSLNPFHKRVTLRQSLWSALPRGRRSFRDKAHKDFVEIRKKARMLIKLLSWLHAIPAAILIILILAFKARPVWTALRAIFSSSF
ncbi:hypothetical protein AOQ73_25395 [Bradyrhizobium pachyrhizi]|nr:hypothetical protein AOQ73_25395 [Bradyrhizobium pachyrhizi]